MKMSVSVKDENERECERWK